MGAPVQSSIILRRRLCAEHCSSCSPNGGCTVCERGFVLQTAWKCSRCAANCNSCDVAGAGGCDASKCAAGFGLVDRHCVPCRGGRICELCELDAANGTSPRVE